MATEWDAESYHRVADPQFAWGRRLVETLDLRGNETVLDAGCGSGRLTRLLLERLPRGRLVAVDLSERMLEAARRYLEPEFAGRIEYIHEDLATVRLPRAVDLVFSTATFHWIPRQEVLFRNLWQALLPGGRLVAQWGAKENLSRLHARAEAITAEPAFQRYFTGWVRPVLFADESIVRRRLAAAGFVEVETEVFPEPTTFTDRSSFEQFITTVNLRLYLARLPAENLRKAFVRRLVEQAAVDRPPYTLDYVRINARASKP